MDYPGLTDDDLGNVRALNRLYLRCMARLPEVSAGGVPALAALTAWLAALSEKQFERLASSPFLLFSLREHDCDYWEQLLADDQNEDLFSPRPVRDSGLDRLAVSSLGFVWQLARRNPYAARVVSGASVYWCEMLGERTLVTLLARTAHRADLVAPRFADDAEVWKKLLSAGVSAERAIRSAAQIAAMQTMLTRSPQTAPQPLRAAACRMPALPTR